MAADRRGERILALPREGRNRGGRLEKPVDTWIVDDSALFREGLLRVLSDTPFEVTQEASVFGDAAELMNSEPHPALLLICYRDGETLEIDIIRDVRANAPQMKIVTLLRHLPAASLSAAFDAGVDGILSSAISFEGLIDTMSLVMAGEKVMRGGPGPFLHAACDGANGNIAGNGFGRNLTRREVQFLQALVRGEPNKVIAKHLGITEATAKVHMKRLFKKTSASNRTQAAIWAVKNGISLEDSSH